MKHPADHSRSYLITRYIAVCVIVLGAVILLVALFVASVALSKKSLESVDTYFAILPFAGMALGGVVLMLMGLAARALVHNILINKSIYQLLKKRVE